MGTVYDRAQRQGMKNAHCRRSNPAAVAICYASSTVPTGLTGEKQRPSRELLHTVLLPALQPLVRLCVALRINPLVLVAAHSLCALLAAVLLLAGRPYWPWAALLLCLRLLLDNLDGSVARASGKVTLTGRYFDTGMDLITNLALFVALAFTGNPYVAAPAFVFLTWMLSLDYNLERLYHLQRQVSRPVLEPAPAPGPQWLLQPFRRLYDSVLAPQDRLVERLELGRFARLAGRPVRQAPLDWQLAWFDRFATASLVNVGLSTQSFLLALLALLGRPGLYLQLVLVQALAVLLLQLWRGQRFRGYIRARAHSAG